MICLGVLNVAFHAMGWQRERQTMDVGYVVRLAGLFASYMLAALVAVLMYWWIAVYRRPKS